MKTGPRVLITGAGGFVGGALARGFAELGWDVIGVDRSFDTAPDHARIRQLSCTLTDRVPDELRAVGAIDVIVHGAWVTTDPEILGISEEEYRDLNLDPLVGAIALARSTAANAFVFLSSSGVFGAGDAADGRGLTDTDEPTGTSPYGSVKLEAERRVLRDFTDGKTAGHVVRLGYLFGPHEVARDTRRGVSLVGRWIASAREERALEVRVDDPLREWTFAPDLAGALALLVENPPPARPLHLGSTHVYRDSEIAGLIADAMPGTDLVEVAAGPPVKPPMIPSDVAALGDFTWTDARTGLGQVLARATAEAASR